MPGYLKKYLYLTLGFGAVVAGFFIAGEHAPGWDGMSYIIYGMGVAALWALVGAIYLAWVVLRGGWQKSKIPALFILVVIVAFSALLILREY